MKKDVKTKKICFDQKMACFPRRLLVKIQSTHKILIHQKNWLETKTAFENFNSARQRYFWITHFCEKHFVWRENADKLL